jgi:hypothetical protein
MITIMAGSGSEQKKRMIPEEEKQSNNIPSSLFGNPLRFAVTELGMHETRFLG